MESRSTNIWRSIDWVTVILYLILVLCGWVSIYAASYDFDNASIFDFAERSGKQLMWIGLSLLLAFMILMVDFRVYETYAYLFYGIVLLLLVATIFLAPDIKGSHSWLVLGPVSLQPAEFAKFATALALARSFGTYGFSLKNRRDLMQAVLIIVLPIVFIIAQKETGSALVFASLIFVLYREGLSGLFLFYALCAIVYFVVAVKYSSLMWGAAAAGEVLVFILIFLVVAGMLLFYQKNTRAARYLMLGYLAIGVVCGALLFFGVALNLLYVCIGVTVATVVYLLVLYFSTRSLRILTILATALVSVAFLFSVDYAFNEVLEPHQQKRIKVALGMEEDLRGAGYNVNQSKIAIGSGGFWGKGFLNGTQTKLKYVPEQDTDFIFCTIGEEEGFWGAVGVILLFVILIFRLMAIGERQHSAFGRVYAYCVVSILFFHLAVNVGMVIGLCPVIGIPLPFFSYGGSSLWGFTILLFVLLRIDASRTERH